MKKEKYLDLMEQAVGAYTDEQIAAYTEKVRADGLKEHGYPRLTANIGILLAYVQRFSIQNLTIRDPHCWSISHEHCRDGLLRDLRFEATAFKMIDGKRECLMNQDGIDLRQG